MTCFRATAEEVNRLNELYAQHGKAKLAFYIDLGNGLAYGPAFSSTQTYSGDLPKEVQDCLAQVYDNRRIELSTTSGLFIREPDGTCWLQSDSTGLIWEGPNSTDAPHYAE